MPEGIIAEVDGGFATLDFVDLSLRGPSLNALLAIGGPESIETLSRPKGPRRQYRVPAGNAREAGLLDEISFKLDTDGNPDTDVTGGTGTTTGSYNIGQADTGAAAALKSADPNVNPGLDKENWHTPVAEYTSDNAFVGTVDNDTVLHNRGQVFTGDGDSVGGDMEHPETHADLIARIKDGSDTFQVARSATAQPELRVPVSHINTALKSQPSALGSDPGGYASTDHAAVSAAKVGGVFGAPVVAPGPVATDGRPAGLPDGEPDADWKRPQLDAYATWKGVENPAALGNKGEVLAAIADAIKAKG